MKKNRPAVKLCCLCKTCDKDELSRLMLAALKQPVDLNEEIDGDVTL